MELNRALSVAIEACMNVEVPRVPECGEAAAVLREFVEKGLPFYRAAEAMASSEELILHLGGSWEIPKHIADPLVDAYRAAKEGK